MKKILRCPVENGSGGAPPNPTYKAKQAGPDRVQKQLRILVVDDDTAILRGIMRMSKLFGAEAATAGNGKEALMILENDDKFDLILLDLNMPVMEGREVLRALQKEGKQDLIEMIVVHSATLEQDLDEDVKGLVEKRVLPKPSELKELRALFSCAREGRLNEWRPPGGLIEKLKSRQDD